MYIENFEWLTAASNWVFIVLTQKVCKFFILHRNQMLLFCYAHTN